MVVVLPVIPIFLITLWVKDASALLEAQLSACRVMDGGEGRGAAYFHRSEGGRLEKGRKLGRKEGSREHDFGQRAQPRLDR